MAMAKTLERTERDQEVTKTTDPDELLARLQRLPRVELGNLTAADVIREAREERTDQIIDAVSRR